MRKFLCCLLFVATPVLAQDAPSACFEMTITVPFDASIKKIIQDFLTEAAPKIQASCNAMFPPSNTDILNVTSTLSTLVAVASPVADLTVTIAP